MASFQKVDEFFYDLAGQLFQRTFYDVATSNYLQSNYVFDDRGLMKEFWYIDQNAQSFSISRYSYDALGNRLSKTVDVNGVPGETTNYLNAPIFGMSHVLAELAPDMSIKSSYIYAGPQLLKEEPSTTDRSRDLYMLHEGKVGSITHTVDMNGSIRNEYDYDTFGTRSNVRTANTGSNQHFGYTGEMSDAESGLLYLRARYYDPSIGRFISADPYLGRMAEPVTQNRYIYVHNNPLLFVDPSGLCSVFNEHESWWKCTTNALGINTDNFWTYGYHVSTSTVNPLTSGGGSVDGHFNEQTFFGENGPTSSEYIYSGDGIGLDVGASAEFVVGYGNGEWAGRFNSVNVNAGVFSASAFWSPGDDGWSGISFGLGLGVPGIAYEETVYEQISSQCPSR